MSTLASKFMAEGHSEAYAANLLKPVRGVFAFAVESECISASPFAGIPRGKLPSCNVTREHREWTASSAAVNPRRGMH